MAKEKTYFVCNECGGTSARWLGKCPACGAWNTLVESVAEAAAPAKNRFASLARTAEVATLGEIEANDFARTPTGHDELDRVLGGGIVEGGVVLIGGDPGIGKSTLLLQALDSLQRSGQPTLYVTGEESGAQVALRARRLGLDGSQVQVLAEIQLEKILATLDSRKPAIAVIDSIQTVYSEQLSSAPGSVAQVRECAAHLTRAAKASGTAIVLVGHVTKEGALAGPRVLEHMVDTVLYFEGDTHSSFRLIRAIKNRFGAVNEIGVFAMTERGLKGVANPSAIFLSQHAEPVPGSCVLVTLEGTRPAAGRNPGAGGQRWAQPASPQCGAGSRSPGDAAGRVAPPRRCRLHGSGRVRQRRGRCAHQRAGGRSGGDAGHHVQLAWQGAAQRLSSLRRGWPGWRGAARAARAGAAEGSGQARVFGGGSAQVQCTEEARQGLRGPDHSPGGPDRRGDGAGARNGLMRQV
jgi:RecA/RadA recombinase